MKWLNITDYPGYYVNDRGEVKHDKKLLKCSGKRYKSVTLCNKIGHRKIRIHILVAIHFIPNPENKKTVNHKDGNKLNNNKSNLEWATYGENNKHAIKMGLRKVPKGISHKLSYILQQFTLDGEFVAQYNSTREAKQLTGISASKAARGKRKQAGGYIWKYIKQR